MTLSPVVVIAYGNSLRRDDGLAWCAGEELKKRNLPGVEILQVHQLAPELAEKISRCDAVIFIDASAATGQGKPGEIRVAEMGAPGFGRDSSSPFHHHYSPASLLALAAQLYNFKARAFMASLVGQDFGPGEHLSPAVEGSMPEFVARIENLILELTGSHPKTSRKT